MAVELKFKLFFNGFLVVNLLVESHLGKESESFTAFPKVALIGVLADMASQMLVQLVFLGESLLAVSALEAFLARVYQNVAIQGVSALELEVAV